MFNFRKFRKLSSVREKGSFIESNYLLYLNNDDVRSFDTREQLLSFVENYRLKSEIFDFRLFRTDLYQLN